eukprot:gene10859-1236_t
MRGRKGRRGRKGVGGAAPAVAPSPRASALRVTRVLQEEVAKGRNFFEEMA